MQYHLITLTSEHIWRQITNANVPDGTHMVTNEDRATTWLCAMTCSGWVGECTVMNEPVRRVRFGITFFTSPTSRPPSALVPDSDLAGGRNQAGRQENWRT